MDFGLRTIDIDLASLQIGFLASGFTFGILTVQVLIYNRKFAAKDSLALRSLVFVIWFLELGQLGCVAHAVYTITITESGNLLALLRPPRTIGVSFLLGSCVGPLVEAFYVSRLLRFSGRMSVAVVGWALALARFGGWVYLSIRVVVMQSLLDFVSQYGWLLAMLLGLSAVIDLTISAWIAYFLSQQRSRARTSTNESARQLLDRVILWTLQTGVITSLAFLITLICYLVLGQYLIWLAVLAILTKVSSNCFLASLNARSSTKIRRGANGSGFSGSQRQGTGAASSHIQNTAHSFVNGIIDLYHLSSSRPAAEEEEHPRLLLNDGDNPYGTDSHFASVHRSLSRASMTGGTGDVYDRSAFSPDGTVVSNVSAQSRRSAGGTAYWAL